MNGVASFLRASYWARFLIPVGLVLIVFSIFVFIGVDKTKNYPETEATVCEVKLIEEAYDDPDGTHHEATYTVFVDYTVDGKVYGHVEYGDFQAGYKTGDKVTIRYNPDKPEEITQPNTFLLPILLLAGGVAALVGGIASIVVEVKKHKKLKEQEKEWATDGN